MNDAVDHQNQCIQNALNFIGVEFEKVTVKITTMPNEQPPIVEWVVTFPKGHTKQVIGQHELLDDSNTHASVIMTIGISQHRASWLIFDIIVMASQVLHALPDRNTIGEIVVRWLIRDALKKMPKAQIRKHLEAVLNIEKNLDEEYFKLLPRTKVN